VVVQLIGCSHHACSVEFRERIAIGVAQVPETLDRFQDRFPGAEAVLLSTCNRMEIYTAADLSGKLPSPEEVTVFLAEQNGLDPDDLLGEVFRRTGEDAIRHLFMVAASLDSMVIGESQILSQVKQAYQLATESHSTGQLTHAAFQSAIRVAKRIANETSIHRKRVSIPSVAIGGFAKQIFERLDNKSILVIGAGTMGEETLRYLVNENAHDITIVNRNPKASASLARQFDSRSAPWDQLDEFLVRADLVVSTTGSAEPIVSIDRFRRIEPARYQRPLFILDLALPRDFDAAIGDCLGVYLYTIDNLSEACEANRRAREEELPRAERIVEEETQKFMTELHHRTTGPTIRRLRESAESIRDAELQRLFQKLDADLDLQSRQEIERSFGRLVKKLFHPPLESLKENRNRTDQAHLLDALRKLFRLPD